MDIHVLNYNDDSIDNNKESKSRNKTNKKEEESETKIDKKKKNQKNRLLLNDLETENLILRIKTEGDEESQPITLRNEYLRNLDKDNDALFEKILECKLVFPKYIPKLGKSLIEKILV